MKLKPTEKPFGYFSRNAGYLRQSRQYRIGFNNVVLIDDDTADLYKRFLELWNEVYQATA